MKKSIIILAALLCLSIIFSAASAFQTEQDQLPDISSFFNKGDSGPKMSVQALTLNSVEIYGDAGTDVQPVLDMLAGTKLELASQPGETSRFSLDLSLPDVQLLTLSVQSGTPYYVGSNFLGENMYMVYPEDEFEEKLTTAFYHIIEQVSEDNSNLPPLDEVLAAIKAIKQGKANIAAGGAFQGIQNISLTEEINTSAFMELFGELMTRIGQAEPSAEIAYRYADFPAETYTYEWPAEATLPKPAAAAAAMSGTFYGEDIIKFVDCLKQFLSDNPELADAVNQIIIAAVKQSDPEAEIPEGTDVLPELVGSLQESAQGLENYYLSLKLDNDESGVITMITIEIGQPSEIGNQGIRITVIPASDYPMTAVDAAADMFAGEYSMPLFRTLYVLNSDDLSTGLNFILAPDPETKVEYAQHTSKTENLFGSFNTDTVADYVYLSGPDANYSGHASILTTAETNLFDGENESTMITYTHQTNGSPVFSVSFTADEKTEEALPILTPADAVHASDMTAEDYDDLAGTIFLQIMQIMMNFM